MIVTTSEVTKRWVFIMNRAEHVMDDLKSQIEDLRDRQLMIENYIAMQTSALLFMTGQLDIEDYETIVEKWRQNTKQIVAHRNKKEGDKIQWLDVADHLVS